MSIEKLFPCKQKGFSAISGRLLSLTLFGPREQPLVRNLGRLQLLNG